MQDPVSLYIQSLDSNHSIDNITRSLTRFSQRINASKEATMYDIPWPEITYARLQAYRMELVKEGKTPDTIATYLSYLKSVIRVAATMSDVAPEKRVPHSTLVEIAQNLKPPKRSGELVNQYIPLDEFQLLMDSTNDGTNAGKRDRALLHILYGCGLRRSEIAGIRFPDAINWQKQHIVVVGKGNKRRHIPMFPDLETSIEDYLYVRGENPGPLFHPVSKGDKLLQDGALTSRGIVDIIRRRCLKVGIQVLNAHSFRASFATTHFMIGTDLNTIQRLMGHSSPTTTQRYDLRDDSANSAAMNELGSFLASKS